MPNLEIRRDDSLLCGRLVAMSTTASVYKSNSTDARKPFVDALSIDFPAMPDSIELARSAEYKVINPTYVPDGVHQYIKTSTLEIPFSFTLHADDTQFCKQGALTLLQLTARLQSFILPIGHGSRSSFAPAYANSTVTLTDAGDPAKIPAPTAPKSGDEGSKQSQAEGQTSSLGVITGAQAVDNPVTCWLHLIYIDESTPGISCIGYVKDVNVKLNGPWRRGINNSFNLPSSGNFSFTFVHRPGHGNGRFNPDVLENVVAFQPQAYANDVLNGLYNTRHLAVVENYSGLDQSQ